MLLSISHLCDEIRVINFIVPDNTVDFLAAESFNGLQMKRFLLSWG